jgi:hypothetical protein
MDHGSSRWRRPPWRFSQSYWQDRELLLREPIDDGFCSSAACGIA